MCLHVVNLCLCVDLNAEFDEMLRRNDDAVKRAISNLNVQTIQHSVE